MEKYTIYVYHAITHEAVRHAGGEFMYSTIAQEVMRLKKIGLDGEVHERGQKIEEFHWNE